MLFIINEKQKKNTWLNSCCQIVKAEYEKKKVVLAKMMIFKIGV